MDASARRTPIIYCLLKIHKDAQSPPRRPIVNGIESVSSRLGQYIDFFMNPLVCGTRAFLRDTKHIIQIIETLPCTSSSILVTADVGSLYTIIGHRAIKSVKWALTNPELNSSHRKLVL